MTKLIQTYRGVTGKIENKCGECSWRRNLPVGNVDAVLVICENEESDHFGHVLDVNHPACDKLEIIQLISVLNRKDVDDATGILDKIKTLFDIKTDTKLAEFFDVHTTTINTWRSRNSVPYEKIIDICLEHNLSLDELFLKGGCSGRA